MQYADYEVVNGLNLYIYCFNNPVMNIDPEGTWSWKGFGMIVATARGAKSAYTQVMNRMSNAIFNAAQKYAINSIIKVLGYYAASSALLSGLSFISNW